MLDWLIIGGGVHGTYLSLYLTRRRDVPAERLRVIDPYPEPLALWNHFAANTGMEFLRSSHAHNLHFDPFSLVTFARTQAGAPLAHFIEPYGRPALALFQAHNRLLIERYHLDRLRITGRVSALTRLPNGWRVETEQGSLEAHNIIIAVGSTEQPYWPDWACSLRAANAPIHHIFDPAFRRADLPDWGQAVVVGGGITAAQTATSLAIRAPGHVTLLMRHAPRVHQFDADTGWITPRYLDGFYQEHDYTRRRAMITAARHRGSMPPDIAAELQTAVENGLLTLREDEVVGAHRDAPSMSHPSLQARAGVSAYDSPPFSIEWGKGGGGIGVSLTLASGQALTADQLILATGFDARRPGGVWLDAAVTYENLPLAPDGCPLVDPTLCWSSGLYVSGPLAELEIGPVARNMVGVRLAAERIGASL
jgi:Pyridine nucleotide-disulphide oxidoreductase